MSPWQYQKQLRLQEARSILRNERRDARTVSRCVRYESCSQFSREYSRVFGSPPVSKSARGLLPRQAPTAHFDWQGSERHKESHGRVSKRVRTRGQRSCPTDRQNRRETRCGNPWPIFRIVANPAAIHMSVLSASRTLTVNHKKTRICCSNLCLRNWPPRSRGAAFHYRGPGRGWGVAGRPHRGP
jgi:AraC-like DNA-binding protein